MKLVENQYIFFRAESGLDSLIAALSPLQPNKSDAERMRSLAPIQDAALAQASQLLDEFLPSALMDGMEQLRRLQDSKLAREITEQAAERFCMDFEHIESMLMLADELADQEAENSGRLEMRSLRATFPRTTGEIRVLLS